MMPLIAPTQADHALTESLRQDGKGIGFPRVGLVLMALSAILVREILWNRYRLLDEEDCEPYTDVYRIKYVKHSNAQFAKRKLDNYKSFSNLLEISYGPNYDTKNKLEDRRWAVLNRMRVLPQGIRVRPHQVERPESQLEEEPLFVHRSAQINLHPFLRKPCQGLLGFAIGCTRIKINAESMALKPVMRLLRLQGFPILQQLHLEERLLRTTHDNWCLLNDGTIPPAIVMGISGKPEQLLHVERVVEDRIHVIKRFSGGGTVVVDEGTLFVTLICNRSAVPTLELYPRPIMSWTEQFYVPVFKDVPGFQLREHDYVFNNHKFGGNAQSIIKDRWLHHTSFLWDYQDSRMALLKLPQRIPAYRQARTHADFICRLQEFLPSRNYFMEAVVRGLELHFDVQEDNFDSVNEKRANVPHLNATKLIGWDELAGGIPELS